ncbi:MAG: methionyl-tRNA formyltransferase [Alphaproteobacteria bacterium]|nr:methionyl-tRNA formyltransferase [Alphaproteobacteria bacterium]
MTGGQLAWGQRPRCVSILVDNPSWVLPYAERLRDVLVQAGDDALLVMRQEDVRSGGIAFFLGCLRLTRPEIIARNFRNLVIHAGDLPRDKGFSPWTWSILRGQNRVPVCLLEAAQAVDSGDIVYKEWIEFDGHELVDEIRDRIGNAHVDLCARFMSEPSPLPGVPQSGEPTLLRRRGPEDSRIDPTLPLAEQFDLLRVVDNERYPAFFEHRGHRYMLTIRKSEPKS